MPSQERLTQNTTRIIIRAIQVLQDLPKKTMEVVMCNMTDSQKGLYKGLVDGFKAQSMLWPRSCESLGASYSLLARSSSKLFPSLMVHLYQSSPQ